MHTYFIGLLVTLLAVAMVDAKKKRLLLKLAKQLGYKLEDIIEEVCYLPHLNRVYQFMIKLVQIQTDQRWN